MWIIMPGLAPYFPVCGLGYKLYTHTQKKTPDIDVIFITYFFLFGITWHQHIRGHLVNFQLALFQA
jgi:hypothetical protein